MATVDQHIGQWEHNRAFAKTIEARYRDWQINVIFYTALHLIDAALVALGINVTDHVARNDEVRKNASFAAVRSQYLNLYRISRVTRYDADADQWLPQSYLTVADLVEDLLRPIENGIAPLLKRPIKAGPLPLKQ